MNLYSIIVNSKMGQKPNFRCSHTLSFTAENVPTIGLKPDNSKVKCSSPPRMETKDSFQTVHSVKLGFSGLLS